MRSGAAGPRISRPGGSDSGPDGSGLHETELRVPNGEDRPGALAQNGTVGYVLCVTTPEAKGPDWDRLFETVTTLLDPSSPPSEEEPLYAHGHHSRRVRRPVQ